MTPRLDDRAIRGVPWVALTFGANKVITVATTLVLARLLAPSDFGVIALATLTIGLLTTFGNLGLGNALILRRDLDRRGKGTALSLMLILSGVIGGLIAALAPLAEKVFDAAGLRDVLTVLTLFVLPSGITWFYEALMQRALEFRSRFLAQTVQSCSLAAVSIGAAAAGLGVWSMVAGQVVSVSLYALALVLVSPDRVRPAWDQEAARGLIAAGRGFMFQGGLAFLKQNTDYMVVGRVLGTGPLGFYAVAYRLSELPYWGIVDPVAKVTFPAFAQMQARGDDLRQAFLSVLQSVVLVSCPLGVILSGAADPFTRAVFGERWVPMAAPLAVLGLWGGIRPIPSTIGWLFNSVGMAAVLAKVSAATLLILIPGLVLSATLGGITAVAVTLLTETVAASAMLSLLAQRRLGISVVDQWRVLRPAVAGSFAGWVVSRLVAVSSTSAPDVLRLAGAATLGACAYVLVVVTLDGAAPRRSLQQIRRMVQRVGPEAQDAGVGGAPDR